MRYFEGAVSRSGCYGGGSLSGSVSQHEVLKTKETLILQVFLWWQYSDGQGFCRPLRNHSATWPHGAGSIYSIKYLGNRPHLCVCSF
jgi:hypothetical protein